MYMIKDYFYCYHGDCIAKMKELINNNIKVDLIISDPPYLMKYKTNYRVNKTHDFCSCIPNDNNPELIEKFISLSYDI